MARFYQGAGRGVTPAEAEALFDEISGGRFKPFFDKYIRGTDDLPLAKLLAPFGVKYSDERKSAKPVWTSTSAAMATTASSIACTKAAPPTVPVCRQAMCWWR
jgi:predicted metalloprotease with PDZ domain